MGQNSQRFVGVDVLRAGAIVAVLASHLHAMGPLLDPPPPRGAIETAGWALASVGDYGVVLFFAISGFVIANTIIHRDGDLPRMRIGAFYMRRVARIGPALLLSIALGTVALFAAPRTSPASAAIVFGDAPHTPAFWLSIATFTFNYLRFYTVLFAGGHDWGLHWGVLWSLSVEEQFYLLFPLLVRRASTRLRLFAALGKCIGVGIVSRWALRNIPGFAPLLTPNCLDALALGVAAAAIPSFALRREWALRMATLGLAVLILAPVSQSWVVSPTLVAAGAVLVMLPCQNGPVFTGIIWRPLARIGRVSYGMYLFHFLVLWGLMPLLHGMAFVPALAIFVGAVTLAAEISFRMLEQPAARWILSVATKFANAARGAGATSPEPLRVRVQGQPVR